MFYDVAIIGAGPCALAVAARLREKTPAALFTQDEHDRLWRRHNRKESLNSEHKRRRTQCSERCDGDVETPQSPSPSIVVLDSASGTWMSTWKQRFAELNITHLRSPLFFHPGPHDRDGLLAFAHEKARTDELIEIENVVGKELSKHEQKQSQKRRVKNLKSSHLKLDGRDQIDYHVPSSKLFCDYCEAMTDQYRLQNIVTKAVVSKVSYGEHHSSTGHQLFEIDSSAGTYFARFVVVAVGSGQTSVTIPGIDANLSCLPHGQACHIFDDTTSPITKSLTLNRPQETILVVGGGLTSAQVIDVLLTKHNNHSHITITTTTTTTTTTVRPRLKIHLLTRSPTLKVKPFDISLPWVTKTRNHHMSAFYMADSDSERLSMLRTARNGGSITPTYHKRLMRHVKSGDLVIHTGTQLRLDHECVWDGEKKVWTRLGITPRVEVGEVAHVVFATGVQPDLHRVAFLDEMKVASPIVTLAGLPVLTEDLAWSEGVPLFFTGALAALRLGPGAGNLMGARLGAERIAWAIEERMEKGNSGGATCGKEQGPVDGHREEQYMEGLGSRFAVLGDSD